MFACISAFPHIDWESLTTNLENVCEKDVEGEHGKSSKGCHILLLVHGDTRQGDTERNEPSTSALISSTLNLLNYHEALRLRPLRFDFCYGCERSPYGDRHIP
eukprot:Blabericola_migrator_1__7016@NODE_3559_length_1678_cov_273_127250_g1778_i1_p3_GENE_NODE_3559_length_1678_cov_273_127250_g1778_i1NODE_3559_length_1678_cov_273_127250_g1778_i1_p3_ORF_typecomplete_len103_score6_55_NODE_3559_length_1678_cov_273_127250_g1778_i112741582